MKEKKMDWGYVIVTVCMMVSGLFELIVGIVEHDDFASTRADILLVGFILMVWLGKAIYLA